MTTSATTQPLPRNADPDAAERRRVVSEGATSKLREDFAHELGISYGPHQRQIFDCYFPPDTTNAPVMVFLHGGGFRVGSPSPVAYYGRPILQAGGIFVSLGYRLAPEVRFPDTAEDAELGLEAISDLLDAKGAQASSLYLSGHSAGAALSALAALRPQARRTEALAGLVLVSGQYNYSVQAAEVGNRESARYVPDLTKAVKHVPPHTIVIAGDRDLPAVMPAAEAMLEALREKGASVEFFVEQDADHFDAIRGFATEGTPTATSVLEMMGLK